MSQKKRNAPETEAELLDAFLMALGEIAPDTEEEIDAFLAERGYNLEEFNARSERVLKPMLDSSPLNMLNLAKQEREKSAKQRIKRIAGRLFTREENLAYIEAMRMNLGMAVHYRNRDLDTMTDAEFDTMSDAELQSMRDDLESLQADDENKPAENE